MYFQKAPWTLDLPTQTPTKETTPLKELIIITGPPGAGKAAYAKELGFQLYSTEAGNKAEWRDHAGDEPAFLVTAAAGYEAKVYWLEEAKRFGFTPRLLVINPGQSIAADQLIARARTPLDSTRSRIKKKVARWFKMYSPHPQEVLVRGR